MNALTEAGWISEINYAVNFGYIVNDSKLFLPTEYKVLQSQGEYGFVKCMKTLYNGKIQLYYLTNDAKSFADILYAIDAEKYCAVVENLLANVLEVKNNGFLSCRSVDISPEHIYVNPATCQTELVYVPLSKRLFNDTGTFENELRSCLLKMIQNTSSLKSAKIMQLKSDLSDGARTLEEIYRSLKEEFIIDQKKADHQANGTMKIVAMNAPAHLEIVITKDEFVLGRKQETADGVIPYSRMIGRTHCKVNRHGNQYTVTDLQAMNGTYVNQVRLEPHKPCLLKDGDVLRLANSDFLVMIS